MIPGHPSRFRISLARGAWRRLAIGIVIALPFLALAVVDRRPIHPIGRTGGAADPFDHGPFQIGAYAADAAALPPGLRARGSYVGGDPFQGAFQTAWYQRRHSLAVMVAGYPHHPGNSLAVELRLQDGSSALIPYAERDPGEAWRRWIIELPDSASKYRLVAEDGSSSFEGWLAISEPFRVEPRFVFWPQSVRTLLALLLQGLLGTLLAAAAAPWIAARLPAPAEFLCVLAGAAVAGLGYLAFWIYFLSPAAGQVFSFALLAWAAVRVVVNNPALPLPAWRELRVPWLLAGVIGLGYAGLTCLYDGGSYSHLAANRFVVGLPVDNQLPATIADRLWQGLTPRGVLGDWHSSDRPPLQSGCLLLTWPVAAAVGFDADTGFSAAGICFQLLWVPALWAMLRVLGAGARQAASLIAALSFSGLLLLNSAYTWPKLAAASLMLTAFLLWWAGPFEVRPHAAGGACAALGWLAHGGVAFSLLALAPFVLREMRTAPLRSAWMRSGLIFLALWSPWIAYQRFYDPPGDRLLKWHLAGAVRVDSRTFPQALIEDYRQLGWRGAWANRRLNLRQQWAGDWRGLWELHPPAALVASRWEQFEYALFSLGWWLPASVLLPWTAWAEFRRGHPLLLRLLAWVLGTWVCWLTLMFEGGQAVLHQGSLVGPVALMAVLAWCALRAHRALFLLLACAQAVLFVEAWTPGTTAVGSAIAPMGAIAAILAAAVLLGTAVLLNFRWQRVSARPQGVGPCQKPCSSPAPPG